LGRSQESGVRGQSRGWGLGAGEPSAFSHQCDSTHHMRARHRARPAHSSQAISRGAQDPALSTQCQLKLAVLVRRAIHCCAFPRSRSWNDVLSPLQGALWCQRGDFSPAREQAHRRVDDRPRVWRKAHAPPPIARASRPALTPRSRLKPAVLLGMETLRSALTRDLERNDETLFGMAAC
jgi:hypothetical protein